MSNSSRHGARSPRPTATIVSCLALGVAAVGTAVALSGPAAGAAATIVNIADPTTPANVARVDAAGKLEVGDGVGPLTVDGTTQLAVPANLYHSLSVSSAASTCTPLAAPPAGKALLIRQVRFDVFTNPTPGNAQGVVFFNSKDCTSNAVGAINPPGFGLNTVTFDPGVGIPSSSALSYETQGSVGGSVFADGYVVAAGAVPPPPADHAHVDAGSAVGQH